MVTSYEILTGTAVCMTLEMAKKHLNIEADYTDDDTLIQMYVDAAVSSRVAYMGRPLSQVRKFYLNDFTPVTLSAFGPATLVVEYLALNDLEETELLTLSPDNYTITAINGSSFSISFKGSLPVLIVDDKTVVVTITTAFCPAQVQAAVLLIVGDLYLRRENRGTSGSSTAADDLCRPYRLNW